MKNRSMSFRFLAVMLVLSVPVVSSADLRKKWTQKELLKEAEVAVIATPIEVEETKDVVNLRKLRGNDVDVVRLETKFKINLVLKGDVDAGKEIVISHFKIKKINESVVENPPQLVEFRVKVISIQFEKERKVVEPPDYLLYLKKDKDGRYVPVSGDYHAPDSVFELSKPWSDPTSIQR